MGSEETDQAGSRPLAKKATGNRGELLKIATTIGESGNQTHWPFPRFILGTQAELGPSKMDPGLSLAGIMEEGWPARRFVSGIHPVCILIMSMQPGIQCGTAVIAEGFFFSGVSGCPLNFVGLPGVAIETVPLGKVDKPLTEIESYWF